MFRNLTNINQLNDLHFDVLKEIANIGVGNAIGALSELISTQVKMTVPEVKFLKFNEVGCILGGDEVVVFGVLVNIHGDINGMMMFLLRPEAARTLVNSMLEGMGLDKSDCIEEFTEMELSALEEIGNILCSSYLGAMSRFINQSAKPYPPVLAKDMAAAILSVPAIEFSKMSDGVLFIDTVFETQDKNASGIFLLVPDFDSFGVILTALGVA